MSSERIQQTSSWMPTKPRQIYVSGMREAGRFVRHLLIRIFFHSKGRPRKLVRRILFHRKGSSRKYLRWIVFHKKGHPRLAFERWLSSQGQQPGANTIANTDSHLIPIIADLSPCEISMIADLSPRGKHFYLAMTVGMEGRH